MMLLQCLNAGPPLALALALVEPTPEKATLYFALQISKLTGGTFKNLGYFCKNLLMLLLPVMMMI